MPHALGLQRHVPPPLRLVQAADQDVHVPVQDAIGVLAFLLAVRTLALRHLCCCHGCRAAVPSRLVVSF